MLKRFSSKVGLSISSVILSVNLFAGSDHTHGSGPHGGIVKEFGSKNHLEAVRKGEQISFYVLDAEGEKSAKISKHSGGSITVAGVGKAPEKKSITSGSEFNEESVKGPAKGKVTAIVNLGIEGKNTTAKFSFTDK